MTILNARLRKLETATGLDDPLSLLTDEELESTIAALDLAIRAQTGMSQEEHERMLKETGPLAPLDNDALRDLVSRIKRGELRA